METKQKLTLEPIFDSHKRAVTDYSLVDQIVFALNGAVEAKDRYTNGHSKRVASYSRDIARRLGYGKEDQRDIFYAGMLHDVGKIRISDAIINKAGRLSDVEFNEMRLHTLSGYYILKEVSAISDYAVGARWHHERYDGKGYPNGLSHNNIPLVARIIAVADAYDAMTSNRSYRELLAQSEVRREIEQGAGTQFDPMISRVALEMIDEDKNYELRQHKLTVARTILAVDDDPMVLSLLMFSVKGNPNYRLITASSGSEAMRILEKEAVELVLLDVEMPDVDGFCVLEAIRQKFDDLPVIFMTGDKELDIIHKAESMGISDYLTKPLVIHMLWESIHNVLSTSRYHITNKETP